eukprot:scaffold106_cov380-Prasinococcus_capsulatus_cf.AAC.38
MQARAPALFATCEARPRPCDRVIDTVALRRPEPRGPGRASRLVHATSTSTWRCHMMWHVDVSLGPTPCVGLGPVTLTWIKTPPVATGPVACVRRCGVRS